MIDCPYCDRIFLHKKALAGHIGNLHSNKQQSKVMKNIWDERKKLYSYDELKSKYWKLIPPSHKGKISKRKGRTNIEMLGKEKAEILSKKVSEKSKLFWKNWHDLHPKIIIKRELPTLCSKGQKELYDYIKIKYANTLLNKKVSINKKHYFIDIFIPELNLGIEYNGCYFHGCPTHHLNVKKWNETMYRISILNSNRYKIIPVFACTIPKIIDMENWFTLIEEINNRGVKNGIEHNTSISV